MKGFTGKFVLAETITGASSNHQRQDSTNDATDESGIPPTFRNAHIGNSIGHFENKLFHNRGLLRDGDSPVELDKVQVRL